MLFLETSGIKPIPRLDLLGQPDRWLEAKTAPFIDQVVELSKVLGLGRLTLSTHGGVKRWMLFLNNYAVYPPMTQAAESILRVTADDWRHESARVG